MNKTITSILFSLLISGLADGQQSKTLKNAEFSFQENILTVSTGKVQRVWKWTGGGFLTISYKNLISNKQWAGAKTDYTADWDLPTKIGEKSYAKLISVRCVETDDEKFTSSHLLVKADIKYDCGLEVQYLIRAYPDAPGLWTALNVKSDESFSPEGIPAAMSTHNYYGSQQPVKVGRCEFIPVDFSKQNQRRYWGIYNDPGNRVNTKDMVKEKVIKGWPLFQDEQITWANGLSIESEGEGLILVKESNKTVNNHGHLTGAFYCTPGGVEVTGWGLKPKEITHEFRRTWATWSILFSGDEDEMELALKQFDRIRYPIDIKRDMHILIDTWGSDFQNGDYDKIYGRENSAFEVVEKEIKSASGLGIDIVRIDDGWQDGGTFSKNSWHPNTKIGYSPQWEKTKALSKKYGVGIGLWAAVRYISEEELLTNQKELNVATWKFDFEKIDNWETFHSRMAEIRDFIKKSGYGTQVSWCPEYSDQRYGWYSEAREYGPMYFQNIQNNLPHHIVYVPYITLRHHWMMSKFYNMNDLQCHWQNPARTNPKYSDAYLHSQSYAAMSAFMGAPSCFMLTQLLEPEEKEELKKIIGIYKEHRKDIFESFVFPIGDEPDNASWSGFQMYNPEKRSGYLMIFRELHNKQPVRKMKLRFLKNQQVRIFDLEQPGKSSDKFIDKDGMIELTIAQPADYLFIKYEIDERN